LDHAVGNVPKLVEVLEHIIGFTGTPGPQEGYSPRLSSNDVDDWVVIDIALLPNDVDFESYCLCRQ
jgi:hypothetical protein